MAAAANAAAAPFISITPSKKPDSENLHQLTILQCQLISLCYSSFNPLLNLCQQPARCSRAQLYLLGEALLSHILIDRRPSQTCHPNNFWQTNNFHDFNPLTRPKHKRQHHFFITAELATASKTKAQAKQIQAYKNSPTVLGLWLC